MMIIKIPDCEPQTACLHIKSIRTEPDVIAAGSPSLLNRQFSHVLLLFRNASHLLIFNAPRFIVAKKLKQLRIPVTFSLVAPSIRRLLYFLRTCVAISFKNSTVQDVICRNCRLITTLFKLSIAYMLYIIFSLKSYFQTQ